MLRIMMVLGGLLVPLACKTASSSGVNIVGGEAVKGADPIAQVTVALLFPDLSSSAGCTGTLLDDRFVVTAAHCVLDEQKQILRTDIAFGYGLADRQSPIRIKARPYIHPEWWDIAVLKLDSPAPSFMRPGIKIPQHDRLAVGDPVILAGYGMKEPIKSEPNSQKVELSTRDDSLTKVQVEIYRLVPERRVIHQRDPRGSRNSCFGDSGGPMFLNDEQGHIQLIGVTRGNIPGETINDCSAGKSEYTDITLFQDFIDDIRKNFDQRWNEQKSRLAQKPNHKQLYAHQLKPSMCLTITQKMFDNWLLGEKALIKKGPCPDSILINGKTVRKLEVCPQQDGSYVTYYENALEKSQTGTSKESFCPQ